MRLFLISIGILFLLIALCIIIGKIWTVIAVRKVKTTEKDVKIKRLDELVRPYGFLYDSEQDMFYSRLHPWQRKLGYEKAFDESAVLLSMVVDCEPIYFEYDGKLWLIELWKGQYGMTTGAEIGVYNAKKPIEFKSGDEKNIHYNSADDEELLRMKFVLRKGENVILTRYAKHWWLTAFNVGLFTRPEELTMCIYIMFPNDRMSHAFYRGLMAAGYKTDMTYKAGEECEPGEVSVCHSTVTVYYSNPKTKQPIQKYKFLRWLAQCNNKRNCRIYEKRTKMFETDLDKITFLRYRYPLLYRALLGFRHCRGRKHRHKQDADCMKV